MSNSLKDLWESIAKSYNSRVEIEAMGFDATLVNRKMVDDWLDACERNLGEWDPTPGDIKRKQWGSSGDCRQ